MEKVTGIKSVDFKIRALGHGVVNWNNSPNLLIIDDGKTKQINNHAMPKLRAYTNIDGHWENGKPKYKYVEDVNPKDTPLYISQNCIRHHLFRDEGYIDLQSDEVKGNMDRLLCSCTGLIRGYVIPATEHKRTSALLLTDFIDKAHNGNFEQMGRAGSKEKKTTKSGTEKSTTHFSKFTFGDTDYEAYGSISIEQLQFISLSQQFSRQAMMINNDEEGKDVAQKLTDYICQLGNTDKAKAIYHKNYVRRGSIFNTGEQGILLNDSAIDVLVSEFISKLENLSIRQAKGYMYVDSVDYDFNDDPSPKNMFRIKTSPDKANNNKNEADSEYAVYFEGREK